MFYCLFETVFDVGDGFWLMEAEKATNDETHLYILWVYLVLSWHDNQRRPIIKHSHPPSKMYFLHSQSFRYFFHTFFIDIFEKKSRVCSVFSTKIKSSVSNVFYIFEFHMLGTDTGPTDGHCLQIIEFHIKWMKCIPVFIRFRYVDYDYPSFPCSKAIYFKEKFFYYFEIIWLESCLIGWEIMLRMLVFLV